MSRTKSPIKRSSIKESAKSLFLEHGYSYVSMSLISERAQVSKNTLYSHFQSKADLFIAVLAEHWASSLSPRIRLDDKREPSKVLLNFANELIAYLYKPDTMSLFRILITEAERFPNLSKSIVFNDAAPIQSNLSSYLDLLPKPSSVGADAAAKYFLGMLKEDAFWHVLCGFRPKYTKRQLKQHIKQLVGIFLEEIL